MKIQQNWLSNRDYKLEIKASMLIGSQWVFKGEVNQEKCYDHILTRL